MLDLARQIDPGEIGGFDIDRRCPSPRQQIEVSGERSVIALAACDDAVARTVATDRRRDIGQPDTEARASRNHLGDRGRERTRQVDTQRPVLVGIAAPGKADTAARSIAALPAGQPELRGGYIDPANAGDAVAAIADIGRNQRIAAEKILNATVEQARRARADGARQRESARLCFQVDIGFDVENAEAFDTGSR